MKLSIWSSYYMDLNAEDAIKRLAQNGINCCELSDEHGLELLSRGDDVIKTGKAFAQFLQEQNMEVSQGHLWLYIKICTDEDALEKLYRWIDLYEAIGIKNMVLHCDSMIDTDFSRQEKMEKNIEKLRLLAEYIKNKDITVCLENLGKTSIVKNADDLLYMIDHIKSSRFGICLDTGHLNLTDKDQRQFILKAGDKLKALHIADNHGELDDHLMPFNGGEIDFTEVVKALKEINYKGIFNLEIPGERKVPIQLRDAKIQYVKATYEYLMSL